MLIVVVRAAFGAPRRARSIAAAARRRRSAGRGPAHHRCPHQARGRRAGPARDRRPGEAPRDTGPPGPGLLGGRSRREPARARVIVVDTSVWIDVLNDTPSPGAARFESLLADDAPLGLADVVLNEVLQ